MKKDKKNPSHLMADEGKVLRRISDGVIYGAEVYLGYTHYIDGEKLPEPLRELPDHFEEIDDVSLNNNNDDENLL